MTEGIWNKEGGGVKMSQKGTYENHFNKHLAPQATPVFVTPINYIEETHFLGHNRVQTLRDD